MNYWLAAAQQQVVGPEPELVTYMDGLTTPLSAGQQTLLNTFVTDLKSGLGISLLSEAFDVMYVLAGETQESSLRNLVKRAHDGTLHGAIGVPEFTAFEGFTGETDSNGRYIDTNHTPSDSLILGQNDAAYGTYCRNSGSSRRTYFGVLSTPGYILMWQAGTYTRLNSTDRNDLTPWPAGMSILSRAASTGYVAYKNKVPTDIISPSTGAPDKSVFLLAYNSFGSAPNDDYGLNVQLSFYFASSALTQENVNTITDTFEAYMDANGTGVIP